MTIILIFYLLGRCWPQIHKECLPFVRRCTIMNVKYENFRVRMSFPDCIPAIRKQNKSDKIWPYTKNNRINIIKRLKGENRHWQKKHLMFLWKRELKMLKKNYLYQLRDIRSNEMSMYSTEEKRWIHKNIRSLCQQLGNDGADTNTQEEEQPFI